MGDLLTEQLALDPQVTMPESNLEPDIRNIFGNYCMKKVTREDAENQLKALNCPTNPLDSLDDLINKSARQYLNTGVASRSKSKRWTDDEDQRLREAIEKYGTENWTAVCAYVGAGRTKAQCSQRWNRCLDPKITHNNWTREEEEKLLDAVQRYSDRSWTRVSAELPGRTDVQCRFRYKFLSKKMSQLGQTRITLQNDFNPEIEISATVDETLPSITVNTNAMQGDVIQIGPATEAGLNPITDSNILEQNAAEHN